ATRSSVASAACAVVPTKPMCGLSTGTCDAMVAAALRSSCASAPPFGLLNAYPLTLGMEATDTPADCSACGVSPVVFHAISGSSGGANDDRYRPTQPLPVLFAGFAVDQMSVP